MSDTLASSIVGAVIGGIIMMAIGGAVVVFNVGEKAEDFLRCDGKPAYNSADRKIKSIQNLPANERVAIEDEIRSELIFAADCGVRDAQAAHATFVCLGAFGFEKSRFKARELVSVYEKSANINTPTSPFSFADLCPKTSD